MSLTQTLLKNNLEKAKEILTEEYFFEKVLKYTDLEDNPQRWIAQDNSFYKLESGAKGISKSFGNILITIYKIIHDELFCSSWCRNVFDHIAGTLIPNLEKALDFLLIEHKVDLKNNFSFSKEKAVFDRGDGNQNYIVWVNWMNTQKIQGYALPKYLSYFGEVVVDEPIEDIRTTKLTFAEIQEIYKVQFEKMPFLENNTVLREAPRENEKFKRCVKFLFNRLDDSHWVVRKFVDPLYRFDEFNIKLLTEQTYIHASDPNAFHGMGVTSISYSKLFIPKKKIGDLQRMSWKQMEIDYPEQYLVQVLGLSYKASEDYEIKPFEKYVYDSNGKEINRLYPGGIEALKQKILDNEVEAIHDGLDIGFKDDCSWTRAILLKNGDVVFVKCLVDIFGNPSVKKKLGKQNIFYQSTADLLIYLINESDVDLGIVGYHEQNNQYYDKLNPQTRNLLRVNDTTIFADNKSISEILSAKLQEKNGGGYATVCKRTDGGNNPWGLETRNEWWSCNLQENRIFFTDESEVLYFSLAKVVNISNSKKRNEEINPEIYNPINSAEYAVSEIKTTQPWLIGEKNEYYTN